MKSILLLTSISLLAISCGPRRPGQVGAPGTNGLDGYSLVVDVVTMNSDNVSCKRTDIFQDIDRNNYYSVGDLYQNGFLVCDGAVGEQGEQGLAGEDGEDGTNGLNGQDGLDADQTYNIVEIIDPCGDTPNKYDEVILKLGNGTYLASFSDNANGLNTRFSILLPGNYRTTDGTNCNFTL